MEIKDQKGLEEVEEEDIEDIKKDKYKKSLHLQAFFIV